MVSLAACSDSASTATTQREATETEIVVADQEISNGEISVNEISIVDSSGYVVVYESTNDAPGRRLGVSELLDPGVHQDVVLGLDVELTEPTETFFMIHREASGDTELNHPGPDEPLADQGSIITEVATLSP